LAIRQTFRVFGKYVHEIIHRLSRKLERKTRRASGRDAPSPRKAFVRGAVRRSTNSLRANMRVLGGRQTIEKFLNRSVPAASTGGAEPPQLVRRLVGERLDLCETVKTDDSILSRVRCVTG
jgi:hypothetical protein